MGYLSSFVVCNYVTFAFCPLNIWTNKFLCTGIFLPVPQPRWMIHAPTTLQGRRSTRIHRFRNPPTVQIINTPRIHLIPSPLTSPNYPRNLCLPLVHSSQSRGLLFQCSNHNNHSFLALNLGKLPVPTHIPPKIIAGLPQPQAKKIRALSPLLPKTRGQRRNPMNRVPRPRVPVLPPGAHPIPLRRTRFYALLS